MCASERRERLKKRDQEVERRANWLNISLAWHGEKASPFRFLIAYKADGTEVNFDIPPPKDHEALDLRPFNFWVSNLGFSPVGSLRKDVGIQMDIITILADTIKNLAFLKEKEKEFGTLKRALDRLARAQWCETQRKTGAFVNLAWLSKYASNMAAGPPEEVWTKRSESWSKVDKSLQNQDKPRFSKQKQGFRPNFRPNFRPKFQQKPRFGVQQQQSKAKCFKCGARGHMKRNCPKNRGQASQGKDKVGA